MRTDRRWLTGPVHDAALWSAWVPFAAGALLLDGDGLRWWVGATLAFSFGHQPLTLWLVYGDATQRARHRRLFAWSPVAMAALVLVGLEVSATLVALAAGMWNAAHTLRQRYGIARIYGRLAGHDDGRAERAMLWSWLALAVAMALARAGSAVARTGIGGRNRVALDALAGIAPASVVAVPFAAAVTVVLTTRWWREEARRPVLNPAKWGYLAATAALFVVLAVHPIAGFVGYVGSHAAEYLLVVRRRLATAPAGPGPLARVLGVIGPGGTLALYGAAVGALAFGLGAWAGPALAKVTVLTLGGLHLLHDGFIWRAPRPTATAPAKELQPCP